MKYNIIIADDDSFVLDFIKFFLNSLGYEINIEEFRSGREVERRFDKGLEDTKLAILDHVMDDVGHRGLDIIEKYGKNAEDAGCKLILFTTEDYKNEAFASGAYGYVEKPVTNLSGFEGLVRKALEN